MGQTPVRRDVLTDRLLGVAEFSHAHWFFGNLYEALVRIPDRVAASEASRELPRSPFGAGSPGRYYAPIAPITAPPAAAALMAGWNRSDSRAWLIVAAASSAAGAGATAYLLRSINPVLFFSPQPLGGMCRKPLLKRWYRVHALRLAASAVALAAIHHARTIGRKPRIRPRPCMPVTMGRGCFHGFQSRNVKPPCCDCAGSATAASLVEAAIQTNPMGAVCGPRSGRC